MCTVRSGASSPLRQGAGRSTPGQCTLQSQPLQGAGHSTPDQCTSQSKPLQEAGGSTPG